MFVYLICIYFLDISFFWWLRQRLWPQLHSYCHVNKNRPFYWYLIIQQTCQRWFWNGFWKQICIFGSCHNHINLNIRAICKILILWKLKADNFQFLFRLIEWHLITHSSIVHLLSKYHLSHENTFCLPTWTKQCNIESRQNVKHLANWRRNIIKRI